MAGTDSPVTRAPSDLGKKDKPDLPLTTVWTPPYNPVFTDRYTSRESCNPPRLSEVDGLSGYCSPCICFSGHTSGCTAPVDVKQIETAALCVPRCMQALAPMNPCVIGISSILTKVVGGNA